MKQQVQCCMTAGVAIVGASVIAVAPIAPVPSEEVRSIHHATVDLLAATTPNELLAALQDVNQLPQDLRLGEVVEALINIAEGFAESSVLQAEFVAELPLLVFEVATEVVTGDRTPAEGLALLLITLVSAPTEIAEPALDALIANLPEPIGGADGLVAELQQGALDITDAIVEVINGILLPNDDVQAVAQVQQDISIGDVLDAVVAISAGFAESVALQAEFVAELPLVVFGLATDVLTGDLTPAEGLAELLTTLVSAPTEIAEPFLDALVEHLPEPIGGAEGLVAELQQGAVDITEAIVEVITGILLPDEVLAVAQVQQDDPIRDALEALAAIAVGFGQSAALRAEILGALPLTVYVLATEVLAGDTTARAALAELLTGLVEAPIQIANPALFALIDNLPAPIGTEEGLVAGFQGLGAELTDTLVEVINNILLPSDNVLAVAQVEQDDPIGDVLDRLANIRDGFAESGEVLSTRLEVAPEFFRELAEDVANGDVRAAQALRLVGVRLINGAYLGDDVSQGVLRPAIDGLVDNVPEPVGGEDGVIDTADERATEVATDIRDTIAGDEVNRVPERDNTFLKVDVSINSGADEEETPQPADEKEEEADDADNGTKAPVVDMKSGNKAEPGANGSSTSGPRKGAVKAVGEQMRTTVNNVVKRVTDGNADNSGASNTADEAGSGEAGSGEDDAA